MRHCFGEQEVKGNDLIFFQNYTIFYSLSLLKNILFWGRSTPTSKRTFLYGHSNLRIPSNTHSHVFSTQAFLSPPPHTHTSHFSLQQPSAILIAFDPCLHLASFKKNTVNLDSFRYNNNQRQSLLYLRESMQKDHFAHCLDSVFPGCLPNNLDCTHGPDQESCQIRHKGLVSSSPHILLDWENPAPFICTMPTSRIPLLPNLPFIAVIKHRTEQLGAGKC